MPTGTRTRLFQLVCLFALALLFSCSREQPASPTESQPVQGPVSFVLAFSGNVAGIIDPCGCEENQLGGLSRRAHAVAQLRMENRNLVYVDYGNLLFPLEEVPPIEKDQKIAKARLLIKAAGEMGLGAYAPGPNDFAAGRDEALEVFSDAKFPVVSANLYAPDKGDWLFPRSAVINIAGLRLGVTGLAGEFSREAPQLEGKLEARDALSSLREILPELQKKSDRILLLTTLGGDDRLTLVMESGVDFVLGWPRDPGTPHIRPHGEALVGAVLDRGRDLAAIYTTVTPGHRGFIPAEKRSELESSLQEMAAQLESARKEGNESQASMIEGREKAASERLAELKTKNPYSALILPIREEMKQEYEVSMLVDSFRREQEIEALRLYGNNWETFLQERNSFAGVQSCRTCHTAQYEHWENTSHAHAFAELEKTHQSADQECIQCHTTGYKQVGGFTGGYVPPFFQNVQCESCHGAAAAHVKNPTANKPPWSAGRTICLACHGRFHDETFDSDKGRAAIACPATGEGTHGLKVPEAPKTSSEQQK